MQKRALIVDDERATCELIERVLGMSGIESLILTRSAEATTVLRQSGFAIVFLDLQMKFPDSLELTRQTRDFAFNRMTPVVLISDDPRPNAWPKASRPAPASFCTSRWTRIA